MYELVNEAPFMYTTELESTVSLCFRALDGSNYDVRCAVAKLLGHLLAMTQSPKIAQGLTQENNMYIHMPILPRLKLFYSPKYALLSYSFNLSTSYFVSTI